VDSGVLILLLPLILLRDDSPMSKIFARREMADNGCLIRLPER
jgi:hypothetical protein